MTTKYKLEYIWLDGRKPIPELRGKTQLKSFEKPPTLADMPLWGFDGSSTMQAEGSKSDCILKPVLCIPMRAARTATSSFAKSCTRMARRTRPTCARPSRTIRTCGSASSRSTSFIRTGALSASLRTAIPPLPRAPITAESATNTWASIARTIVEEHLDLCLAAGINHEGINAEVAKGQWEFQIFAKGSAKAADDLWTLAT